MQNSENGTSKIYLHRFPAPMRNDDYLGTKENASKNNFDFMGEEKFRNSISFTKNELAQYFTTQSNIISAIENKVNTYEEIEDWLKSELSIFFSDEQNFQIIYFGNWIKYLQKMKL